VAQASELATHGLKQIEASCATCRGACHVGAAEVAAEFASHALNNTVGVATHARGAKVDARQCADLVAAFALGPASCAWFAAWALVAWLRAAILAALQRARVLAAEAKAWASVAASHGARAVSEMALEASAPFIAAIWGAAVAAAVASC
jgi:Na+/proline symporter